MRKVLISFFLLFFVQVLLAQNNYAEALAQGDLALRNGQYKTAINKYFAAATFDPTKKEVVKAKVDKVLDQIEALRKNAEKAEKEAKNNLEQQKRTKAVKKTKGAKNALTIALSETRNVLANDLAFKAELELKKGYRTQAFRLAEFAHRYVQPNNVTAKKQLFNSWYYNDRQPNFPLNWEEKTLIGHSQFITKVVYSPNGNNLATASLDGTAKIWDKKSGRLIYTLNKQEEEFYDSLYSPNGKSIVTISQDKTIKIWNTQSGKLMQTLNCYFQKIAFSPDGKNIAVVSKDKRVEQWKIRGDTVIRETINSGGDKRMPIFCGVGYNYAANTIQDIAYSPNGKNIIIAYGDKVAKIWSVESDSVVQTLSGFFIKRYILLITKGLLRFQ